MSGVVSSRHAASTPGDCHLFPNIPVNFSLMQFVPVPLNLVAPAQTDGHRDIAFSGASTAPPGIIRLGGAVCFSAPRSRRVVRRSFELPCSAMDRAYSCLGAHALPNGSAVWLETILASTHGPRPHLAPGRGLFVSGLC